jgi:quercetin dioxygenase-like cupin family protein
MAIVNLGRATIIDALHALDLEAPGAAAAAVYDRPIALRALLEDPVSGEEHYLVRYPPGVRGRVHRHTAAHTVVVIEGELDANGTVIGPGSYAHFPGGEPMRHQATEAGCLFVLLFHGPFDVEVVDD